MTTSIVEQFAAAVAASPDVKTERAKKTIIWLFQQAAAENRDTVLVFPSQGQFSAEVAFGIHDMLSSDWSTHIEDIIEPHGIGIMAAAVKELGGRVAFVFTGDLSDLHSGYGKRVNAAHRLELDLEAIEAIQLPQVA